MGVLRKHDEHTVLPERHARDEEAKAKRRTSERRKKRLPVPSDDLPSLKRPAATTAYGIVVVTEIMGELVNAEETAEHHPDAVGEHVWAGWRAATLDELVRTWPARAEPGEYERLRGWWQPTIEELRLRGARRGPGNGGATLANR